MAVPTAVQKVEEAIHLRRPPTVEEVVAEQIAEASAVPTPEQNDAALAQLTAMMGGVNR